MASDLPSVRCRPRSRFDRCGGHRLKRAATLVRTCLARPSRRSSLSQGDCGEAHLPAQQHQASSQARLPCSDVHPWRPRCPSSSSGKGTPQAECVIPSVTRHSSFAALRRDGRRVRSGPVSVIFAAVEPDARLAFAIGKKFGTAVERNRARRRLRAAFNDVAAIQELPAGAYQVSCSRAVLDTEYTRLTASLERCLAQLAPASV